jgi:hypothetical protein
MLCPYCTSEISDAALVCPVCTRDLYLFKPLLQKIDALEKQLQEVVTAGSRTFEERIARLEEELEALRRAPPPALAAGATPAAADAPEVALQSSPRSYISSVLISLGITLLLLLAAHTLIVMVYDLKPLYLRIASLLIPLPFGVALYVWHPHRFGLSALLSLVMACVAVLGMSAVTGYVDKVPVLPQDIRDWREFIEYAGSIALSVVTGLLLGKLRAIRTTSPQRQPNRLVLFLAQLFTTHEDGELGLQKMIARITKLVATLTPVVSAGMSVYAGVRAVIGDS